MKQPGRGSLVAVHWIVLALTGLILMLVGILRYHGPAYRSDEIGYLSKAAAIAGKHNTLASSWHGGYSLLLSPFFRLAGSVQEAWPAVIVVNVMALLLALICYWRCLRTTGVCTKESGFRILLLMLLVLGTTAYIGWAFTNCLMMALIALIALLLRAGSASIAPSAGIGLLAGYAYWVHPTGLLLLPAAALAGLWPAATAQRVRQTGILLLVGLAMIFLYSGVVHPWISSLQGGGQGHYEGQIRGFIEQLRSSPLPSLATLAIAMINGLATSSIATFGYLAAALLALARLLRRRAPFNSRQNDSRQDHLSRILVFLLVTWAGLVAFSAFLSLPEPESLQLAFHQRYTQPVLPGLLAFGMALAPQAWSGRPRTALIATAPIVVALMIALTLQTDDSFSVVDGLGASTIFLDPKNVRLMLLAGLGVTAIVQLAGWRAFLPVAAGFWFLGWHSMDRIHRDILRRNSRLPALAEATATLESAGLRPCIHLVETPQTPNEYNSTMGYYLSGRAIERVDASNLASSHCDVVMRPMDSEADPKTRLHRSGQPRCRPRILDTFSSYLLEECGQDGKYDRAGLHQQLLQTRRDLIDLERGLRLRPEGFALFAATHTSEMPPTDRDGEASPARPGADPPTRVVEQGANLLYGPYLDLPRGTYLAVFDGMSVTRGSLRMDVSSGGGKREHASKVIQAGTVRAVLPFTLPEPVQNVEVRLFGGEAQSVTVLPTSLLIYRGTGKGWEIIPGLDSLL
jgi:hypothetical protein